MRVWWQIRISLKIVILILIYSSMKLRTTLVSWPYHFSYWYFIYLNFVLQYIIILNSLHYANLHLLECSAEASQCRVHHYQCLAVPVELAMMEFFQNMTHRTYRSTHTTSIIKSNFAEHIFSTHHTYTNIETNLEILHTLPKGPKLNSIEQNDIYKHYK